LINSLELADEEDDPIDLQIEIESAFDIRLTDEEASSVRTMGDLHDLLMRRIGAPSGKLCLTTMAFFRLRRAVARVAPEIDLRPSTPLKAISLKPPRALFASLALEDGLRLPSPTLGPLSVTSGFVLCRFSPSSQFSL
jgi:hypothetical protein